MPCGFRTNQCICPQFDSLRGVVKCGLTPTPSFRAHVSAEQWWLQRGRVHFTYLNRRTKTHIQVREDVNIGAMATTPNCTKLMSLGDFNGYIDQLRTETNFDASNLTLCRDDICNAIWGTGNPDISGIGVRRTLSPISADFTLTYLHQ